MLRILVISTSCMPKALVSRNASADLQGLCERSGHRETMARPRASVRVLRRMTRTRTARARTRSDRGDRPRQPSTR